MARVIELPSSSRFEEDLEDGYVLIAGDLRYLTESTYTALLRNETYWEVVEPLLGQPDGLYPIPQAALEVGSTEDLRQALQFAEAGPSEACVMPGCLQDPIGMSGDFTVCQLHADLMQGWDDLLAVC